MADSRSNQAFSFEQNNIKRGYKNRMNRSSMKSRKQVSQQNRFRSNNNNNSNNSISLNDSFHNDNNMNINDDNKMNINDVESSPIHIDCPSFGYYHRIGSDVTKKSLYIPIFPLDGSYDTTKNYT